MRAPMIAVLVMWVTATAVAQQTNTLDAYRQTYEKHAQSILAQYGKDLDTVSTDLKKKGDLDNILLLQAEKKRFDVEKSVPAPKEAQDAFRAATEEYCQAMVALLGQYVKALDGLVKKEVASDRIAEAQGVKMEKDKASVLLADMQTKLPVKAADALTKTAAPTSAISVRSVIKPKTYGPASQ